MDLTRTRLRNYDVTWNSYALGAVDKVTPQTKLIKAPLKVGSVGQAVLGERIVGVDLKIIVQVREIDFTYFKKMLPWWSAGGAALNPATINKDAYDYAALLTLHPQDISGTGEDLSFLKGFPEPQFMDRDGVKEDVSQLTFTCYPDRAQLPALVYGYIGGAPT